MREEEDVVLPLAERVLLDEDWAEIDAAFEGNRDPLIGKARAGRLRQVVLAHRHHRPAADRVGPSNP